MIRVAIIAAIPGELMPFVRGWRYEKRNRVDLWRFQHDDDEWIAACAGAGQGAATRAFAEIEKSGPMDMVVSVGWAGALNESCQPGHAYDVSAVVDARTGERFRVDASIEGSLLVTATKVADAFEKQRLANTYGAVLVDMEAAAVARLASMRRISFFCIKGVSDGFNAHLPDFNRFLSADGHIKLGKLVLFSLLRPWYWSALIEMGENSKRAAQGIAQSLRLLLDEQGRIRNRNGYTNIAR